MSADLAYSLSPSGRVVDERRDAYKTRSNLLGWERLGDAWFMPDARRTPRSGETEEAKHFPNGSVGSIAALDFDAFTTANRSNHWINVKENPQAGIVRSMDQPKP